MEHAEPPDRRAHPASRNGSSYPWFGDVAVTNQHRGIGPVPARGNGRPTASTTTRKYGVPTFTLRHQYIYPTGIRSLRFGQIIFLNVPQYVNLDDEANHQGIANAQQWGANQIGFPPDPTKRRQCGQLGNDTHPDDASRGAAPSSGLSGCHPHRGNPEQGLTTPWGTALVGYPRTYVIGMGVQTLWGNNLIEFLNRPVYPVGWVSCTGRLRQLQVPDEGHSGEPARAPALHGRRDRVRYLHGVSTRSDGVLTRRGQLQ